MSIIDEQTQIKKIGEAGMTERTTLDGSERIVVQPGTDANVAVTPMQFVKYSTIQAKIDAINSMITSLNADLNTAISTHTHGSINSGDSRSVVTTPADYTFKFTWVGLKYNTVLGLGSAGSYSYLVGLYGWKDPSGGNAHEIAFNDTGIFVRRGTSQTTWGAWRQLILFNY